MNRAAMATETECGGPMDITRTVEVMPSDLESKTTVHASVVSRHGSTVAGQRREPATRGIRNATRRGGWRPFAGPSCSFPNESW
jgi:hypothetical protein